LYRRLQTVVAMDVGLVLLMTAKPGLLLSRAAWGRSTAVLAAGR
jgi:hypothetical protein